MNMNKIAVSDICQSFTLKGGVGSYVPFGMARPRFVNLLGSILDARREAGSIKPQMLIEMPEEANELVRSGQGRVPANATAEDFVVREYRGQWHLYLHAKHAAPTKKVSVVVYTRQGYLDDPDVTPEEAERVSGAEYVIVAVLATPFEERPPYGASVLIHNIAGGNNDFMPAPVPSIVRPDDASDWVDREKARLYDWFVKLAKETEAFESDWKVVAT